MKLNYHIDFCNGSNPYFHRRLEAKEAVREVNNWIKSNNYNFNNRYVLFDFENDYRIQSTSRGTWVVYKEGKYCDTVLQEYRWLANAVKFLEKQIQKTLDK